VIDRYCMCKMNGESLDHILLQMNGVSLDPYPLWNSIFRHFSLSWVMPLQVIDLFACWWTGGCSWSVVV
jgi:hypothetical protein